MKVLAWCLVAVGLLAGITASMADVDQETATVILRVDEIVGPVNRNLLGNNVVAYTRKYYKGLYRDRGAGIWDPAARKPAAPFVEAAKAAGTSVLRWPGGENARYVDWKKTVGPIESRRAQQFGLPEFLQFTDAVDATPVITLPETISPTDLADLVEYLNAPRGINVNGGEDWASLRAEDGRREPWDVVWFEFGNETYNMDMSTEDYIVRYRRCKAAMRAVDPRVRLGAVLENSENVDTGWTATVLHGLGEEIDFAIIHPYVLRLDQNVAEKVPKELVALSAVSSDMDLSWRLERYRQAMARYAGNSDIPLAVTEYNGLFRQETPVPYRHALLNALHNADLLRIFFDPANGVALATFWQFANSYWGAVYGGLAPEESIVKRPNQYVFEIYSRYLATEVIRAEVDAPRFDFPGGLGISPRSGARLESGMTTPAEPVPSEWSRRLFLDGDQTQEDGIVRVKFRGRKEINYHHAYKTIAAEPNTLYEVTARVRTINLKGGKVGIAVQDARGWKHTFYQPRNTPLTGSTEWTDVSVAFRTLPDTKAIMVLARNFGKGPMTGTAEFGAVRVLKSKQNFGAVPKLAVLASRDRAGEKIALIFLNKDLAKELVVSLTLDNAKIGYRIVSGQALAGESPYSTNIGKSGEMQQVRVMPLRVSPDGENEFQVLLPPASLAGLELQRQ